MKSLWQNAKTYFPGGVNSPVRAFKSVDGEPVFIESACGSHVTSADGRDFVDYVGSWGPMILGHANEAVVEAVCQAASKGLSFGAPTEAETELAEIIHSAVPCIEKMRFVSSGTEATMSAVRVARGFTGRSLIIKIDGGYHGHGDSLLVSAGSGVATYAIPGCPGVPEDTAKNTLVVPYNNEQAVEECFDQHKGQIACIIVEPVCGNMGVVLPKPGYLAALRKICSANGALLIFDEVMSGFRGCFGGYGQLCGVNADLVCLGKIVGGGMPLAVYGGNSEIMSCVSPDGPVYQAGTLSGNPVAVAAGIATLKQIKADKDFYKKLGKLAEKVESVFVKAAGDAGINVVCNRYCSMMTLFFNNGSVTDYASAKKSDTDRFKKWFGGMLSEGIYLAPSQFEAVFVSAAHTSEDIQKTEAAAEKILKTL